MQFEFTEEQSMISSMLEEFSQTQGTSERVRQAMESELGYLPEVWQSMAGELGLCGLLVPEDAGGQGLTMIEMALVFEQLGKTLLPSPMLATAVQSVALLNALGDQQTDLLKRIARGEVRTTVAVCQNGRAEYVLDVCSADVLLLVDSDQLFLVHADQPGVFSGLDITPVHIMDQTRRMGQVVVEDKALISTGKIAEGDEVLKAVDAGLDMARIALGAEAVGAAQTCLARTVEYASERVQFGRAIGSFQAVKHQCADMMVAIEAAISAVFFAACAVSEDLAESRSMAALAKVHASEALSFCSARMIQLHGGIGFTWEHDAHLYFKRARSTATMLGLNFDLDEVIAADIGLNPMGATA